MKNNLPPVHPGVHIGYALEELDMTPAQAARILGCSRAYLGDLINGKKGFSDEMCYRLAGFIGGTPDFWMGLQDQYDMKMAEKNKKLDRLRVVVSRRYGKYKKKEKGRA